MRGLLLCCLAALATSQNLRYDISLDPKKTYEYKYEGEVKFGLGKANLAESGVRITCKATITGASPQQFLLQVSELAFAEYNGFEGRDDYVPSPKVTKRLTSELAQPFMFMYTKGHVSDIRASAKVSTTVVNIIRGILSFFQLTVKTTQNIYELKEIGIHGNCESNYAIEENEETKDWIITKVVDVTNCKEKAAMHRGMATAMADKLSKERGESVMSTMKYNYTIKPTPEGGLITTAHGFEQQHFSAFNVKGGSFKMEAMKNLVLLSVNDTHRARTYGPLEIKGNIVYKFEDVNINIPMMMQNLDNPVPKAMELIKRLSEANSGHIDNATTEDSMKLYHLMRVIPYEGLENMWKQLAENPKYRRWFLDSIVETADVKVLNFMETRFKANDLTPFEAMHTILMAFHHLQVTPNLIEMAKVFLKLPFSKSNTYLWHTVALSYGSLVNKYCVYYVPCLVTAAQPLMDMATEALRSGNKEEMLLALKALGNAGHPGSIKTIMRFLPGVAVTPLDLPLRVQNEAVQAMRLMTTRDPHSVQDVTLTIFLQKHVPSEVRMHAFKILLRTKPSMALVSTVTARLLEETDLQVASFAYSYLHGLASSRTPDNHYLSIASSLAMKILAPRFGRLSYFCSKAKHVDWFDDRWLTGVTSELFMLRNASNIIPSELVSSEKIHIIGRIIELLELGIRADGIKDLFGDSIPGFKGDFSMSDLMAIFRVLQQWERLDNDKPVLSVYSRITGQEWFFADLSKDTLRNIITAFSPAAGKSSPLWAMMESLQRGVSWDYTRAFLVLEARYFEATSLGLPVEISKYYNTITACNFKAKVTVNPPLTENIAQLLNSETTVETDGYAGSTKDFWVFYGTNTKFFQSGSELKIKRPLAVPWKLSAKINMPGKKFELDFPPSKEEIELLSIRSDLYAVSRNIEEPDAGKMTPMMSPSEAPSPDQALKPYIWHPSSKMCYEYNIYGVGFCMEYKLKRQYYQEEYPLYYFLGYSKMAFRIIPAQTTKAVEKIHFELDVGPSKHPMSARQLLETVRRLSKEATQQTDLSSDSSERDRDRNHTILLESSATQAVFNFKAFAISENQKAEGYDSVMYFTPEANIKNAQLIVSQVEGNTNWKMCVDTSLDAEAKAHITWGDNCQAYDMSMEAAVAYVNGSKPDLKAKVKWSRISEYMTELGKRIERYIPGVALLYGFSQKNERNPEKEVSASVLAAWRDSVDVEIKLPEYTVYNKAMSYPVQWNSEWLYCNMTSSTEY
ncbi:vitellogenin 3, phosvitinless isoform X1 [Poecilia latipinna]|uniref:vitellogenin 3, phosvitinless isoform X1 n=1 Tax=Poecilia latipinna TaxID=48699 RepID=UPI00072E634C|nr:PREDICTED: vitellogenin-like isoform X1 [Poecilia latipinna]